MVDRVGLVATVTDWQLQWFFASYGYGYLSLAIILVGYACTHTYTHMCVYVSAATEKPIRPQKIKMFDLRVD